MAGYGLDCHSIRCEKKDRRYAGRRTGAVEYRGVQADQTEIVRGLQLVEVVTGFMDEKGGLPADQKGNEYPAGQCFSVSHVPYRSGCMDLF